MRSSRWVALMVMVMLGCSRSNARDEADAGPEFDAAIDTRNTPNDVLRVDGDAYEAPRDAAMEVTRESLCVGLDPLSQACAREVLARIDHDACLDSLACATTPLDPRICDVYNPPQGSWMVEGFRRQLVLVRLGRLRVDLDAAVCTLRDTSFCGDGLDLRCGPVLVPTGVFTSCTQTEECGRDGYCAESDLRGCDTGVCRPRLAPGAACDPQSPCAWGQACQGGVCRSRLPSRRTAPVGASCGTVVDGDGYHSEWCAEGLACASDPPVCTRLVSLGAPCGCVDCGVCGASLRCEANVCVPFELPREGDTCERPLQGLCAWGTNGLLCEDGVCVTPQGRIGDVCRIPCIEGYCAHPDESSLVQRCLATRLPLGASCSAIDQCENGLCCDGVCVAVPE